MIKILAKMTIKEDMIGTMKEAIPDFIGITRKEDGCIACQLYQDINDARLLTMIEEWESIEAHQKHISSSHFQEAMIILAAIQEKDMEVSVCTLVV